MARVIFVLGDDFEDSEFRVPYDRLAAAGHDVTVVGGRAGDRVTGKRGEETIEIQASAASIDPRNVDVVVIPGGYSPDKLRTDDDVVQLVRDAAMHGKLVAAVCHGPSLLIDAEIVDGKRLTSWPSIKKDLYNAGAVWEDHEVVEDGNLITSRMPDDLEAFSRAILDRLAALPEPRTFRDEQPPA